MWRPSGRARAIAACIPCARHTNRIRELAAWLESAGEHFASRSDGCLHANFDGPIPSCTSQYADAPYHSIPIYTPHPAPISTHTYVHTSPISTYTYVHLRPYPRTPTHSLRPSPCTLHRARYAKPCTHTHCTWVCCAVRAGGRQIDGTAGTIECVEECVLAAKGTNTEIFLDGGIRRGKDVRKPFLVSCILYLPCVLLLVRAPYRVRVHCSDACVHPRPASPLCASKRVRYPCCLVPPMRLRRWCAGLGVRSHCFTLVLRAVCRCLKPWHWVSRPCLSAVQCYGMATIQPVFCYEPVCITRCCNHIATATDAPRHHDVAVAVAATGMVAAGVAAERGCSMQVCSMLATWKGKIEQALVCILVLDVSVRCAWIHAPLISRWWPVSVCALISLWLSVLTCACLCVRSTRLPAAF